MAIYLVTNTYDIVMAVFDIGQNVVAGAAGVISGDTNIDIESTLEQMRASMETMGIGELLGLSIETLLISLCLKIMSILITVILYGRMIENLLHREHRAHSHCDDEQPRMGQHRHELPQRAVRAGIPRLPHHGVRCDLCRAHQQHDHRSQYPLGAILGGSLYGHSLLLPVQDRFACKVTINAH